MNTVSAKYTGFLAIVMGVFFVHPLFGSDPELMFSSIRQKGMGGTGVAITFDDHSLYTNPAGLDRASFALKFLRLNVDVNSSFFSDFCLTIGC